MFLRDLTEPEAAYYRRTCNFTPEELRIFDLRLRDKSLVECTFATNLSIATVKRRLRSVKAKIARV